MPQAPDTSDTGGLVIVTADGPEHRYVANAIASRFAVREILICDPSPRRKWHKVLRKNPKGFLDKALWKVYLKAISDTAARDHALQDVFGPWATAFPDVPTRKVGRAKAGGLKQAVNALHPDVLAIYGTSLIPDDVLEEAQKISLNMHTGISPRYRGTSCAFWPIHNGEPDWVGATVHECTSDLDGGKIFATKRPTLFRTDTLHHVFARAVQAGAEAYCTVLEAAEADTLQGDVQDLSTGREYPGSARGIISEIKARARLKRMRRDWPEQTAPR